MLQKASKSEVFCLLLNLLTLEFRNAGKFCYQHFSRAKGYQLGNCSTGNAIDRELCFCEIYCFKNVISSDFSKSAASLFLSGTFVCVILN